MKKLTAIIGLLICFLIPVLSQTICKVEKSCTFHDAEYGIDYPADTVPEVCFAQLTEDWYYYFVKVGENNLIDVYLSEFGTLDDVTIYVAYPRQYACLGQAYDTIFEYDESCKDKEGNLKFITNGLNSYDSVSYDHTLGDWIIMLDHDSIIIETNKK